VTVEVLDDGNVSEPVMRFELLERDKQFPAGQ
jgi:hypothetical protein